MAEAFLGTLELQLVVQRRVPERRVRLCQLWIDRVSRSQRIWNASVVRGPYGFLLRVGSVEWPIGFDQAHELIAAGAADLREVT